MECYDYDSDGSHDLIGAFQTTMTQLEAASRSSPVSRVFPGSALGTAQAGLTAGGRVLGDRGLVIEDPEPRLRCELQEHRALVWLQTASEV